MRLDQKRESLFCGLAFLTAAALILASLGYDIESAYFPLLLSLLMGVLAIALFVQTLMPHSKETAKAQTEAADQSDRDQNDKDRAVMRDQLIGFFKIFVAVLAYIAGIQLTNYTVATLAFLILMMGMLGTHKVLHLALVAAGMTALLSYLFFT
ncbi:MAG: tripartite tricarboxylate transporter TctB family protein, partial [Cohaesibacter sp.]|nr:tripartite tricarboxylate transporter TctB family protein [Cohaesibacter sp.]